jgi:hypothetical protein
MYGFVQAKNRRINLERIDPAAGQRDKLDDVLVIFVATQRIIGWYHRASREVPIYVDFHPLWAHNPPDIHS